MRPAVSFLLSFCLAGCGDRPDSDPGPHRNGRYHGIGIYAPGPLWERLADAGRSGDPRAATLRDDDEVIVVVDSQTGEIRQCGNLSGHCIRMNPWAARPSPPVNLIEHEADLDRAAEQEAAAANSGRR